MVTTLVVIERNADTLTPQSLEALTAARELGAVDAVLLVDADGAEALLPQLGDFGVGRLLLPRSDGTNPADYFVGPAVDALSAIVTGTDGYDAVLLAATFEGREIAARLAVRLDAAVVTDVATLTVDEHGEIAVTKEVFAFTWTTTTTAPGRPPLIITLRAGVYAAAAAPVPETTRLERPGFALHSTATRLVSRRGDDVASTGRPDVATSRIVVSAGRGTRGDLSAVEALADALGGAVGGSRVAVDSGWLPHAAQVGQTGSVITPELYVAAGISGAIQHRAGMQTAHQIVVVNSDPQAPLFEIADFGVVGDLFAVLPRAAELVRRHRAG